MSSTPPPAPPTPWWFWLLLAGFAAAGLAIIALAFRANTLLGLGMAAVIALALAVNWATRRRLRAMAAARAGEDFTSFARAFTPEVDPEVVRAVYEALQVHLSPPDLPLAIRPDDDLDHDLRLDRDDLDFDLFTAIAHRTRRATTGAEQNPFYGRVRTVRDLVLFFDAQPPA